MAALVGSRHDSSPRRPLRRRKRLLAIDLALFALAAILIISLKGA